MGLRNVWMGRGGGEHLTLRRTGVGQRNWPGDAGGQLGQLLWDVGVVLLVQQRQGRGYVPCPGRGIN